MIDSTARITAAMHDGATVSEVAAAGRAVRGVIPRSDLAQLTLGARDPLGIIAAQDAARAPELVPLRHERMSASPFAFYRGTAALQAADLAADAHTGILVPSCGDAHLANFGFYASPQRTLVFDLNDFDEAAWAPWEWDLKRLTTSIVIAGQASGREDRIVDDAALAAVRTYARAMSASVQRSPLERYFDHLDVSTFARSADGATRRVLRAAIRDAKRRTGERAVRRLTELDDTGRLRFVETPPTMVHATPDVEDALRDNVARYLASTRADIRVLMTNYEVSDIARRAVGVGSVGTTCMLVLFQDGGGGSFILQAKQAATSVLVEHGGITQPALVSAAVDAHGNGARVVGLQRVLQAVSDPFLGYLQARAGDFYIRQFHDMKGGIDVEELDDRPFQVYARACAATLARAHAQSPQAAAVAGYIGHGRVIGRALLAWARAYADQSRKDYDAFVAARRPAATSL